MLLLLFVCCGFIFLFLLFVLFFIVSFFGEGGEISLFFVSCRYLLLAFLFLILGLFLFLGLFLSYLFVWCCTYILIIPSFFLFFLFLKTFVGTKNIRTFLKPRTVCVCVCVCVCACVFLFASNINCVRHSSINKAINLLSFVIKHHRLVVF